MWPPTRQWTIISNWCCAYVAYKESGLGVETAIEKVARVCEGVVAFLEHNMSGMSDSGMSI